MANTENSLPLVLGRSEILELRRGLLAIQRNGATKDAFENYLPVGVLSKLTFDESKKNFHDLAKELLASLDGRLEIEVTVAFEPTTALLKNLRAWVIDVFKKPATLVVRISPGIGGGAVVLVGGRRYDYSLYSSLLSHENLSRLS